MKMNLISKIKPFIIKHEPEILMSMGISGMLFSTLWGIKATVKAVRKIDIKKKELNVDKLTVKEAVSETWKLYLPVVVGVSLSIPCLITSNKVANRRNAALAAAYVISENALHEYKEKTREIVGEKKEQEIRESISQDSVNKSYTGNNIILTGQGDSLFYDPLSGRYFKSNWNKLLKVANELNARALSDISGEISLSEWFYAIGLKETDLSDNMGWKLSDGPKGLIDISIDATLTPDDIPCGSIYYKNLPVSIV